MDLAGTHLFEAVVLTDQPAANPSKKWSNFGEAPNFEAPKVSCGKTHKLAEFWCRRFMIFVDVFSFFTSGFVVFS